MSEPGLLHHFASKEELLLELLKLRDQHDDERIAQARAAHTRGLDVLLALCRQNEERPGIVRLFTILAAESVDADHPAHDWFLDRYRERRRILVERLADEQREGRVDADLDPEMLAPQILAMFDGLQIQWLLDPDGVDMVAVFEDFLGGCGRASASREVSCRAAPSANCVGSLPLSGSNPTRFARGRPRLGDRHTFPSVML